VTGRSLVALSLATTNVSASEVIASFLPKFPKASFLDGFIVCWYGYISKPRSLSIVVALADILSLSAATSLFDMMFNLLPTLLAITPGTSASLIAVMLYPG